MKPNDHGRSMFFDVIHHATEGLLPSRPGPPEGLGPPKQANHFMVFKATKSLAFGLGFHPGPECKFL